MKNYPSTSFGRIGRALGALNDWLAQRLARVTSSGDLIPEVDGLRFLAIAAVVIHHLVSIYLPASGRMADVRTTAEWFEAAGQSSFIPIAYCGHFGVNLFFVISGFILAIPFVRRARQQQPPPGYKSYYLRRLTRIEPPYIIALVAYLGVRLYDGHAVSHLLPNFLASVFYLHGPIYGRESAINGVAWSLEVEVQFYLLVPLLMRGFRMRDRRLRLGSLLAAIVAFGLFSQLYVYPYGPAWMRMSLLNFTHYFLAGFLLAELFITESEKPRAKSLIWDAVALVAGGAIFWILLRFGHLYFMLPLVVAILYAGFYLGRVANRLIRLRWVVIIGGMCYTIYLYHVMIISQAFVRTARFTSISRSFGDDFIRQAIFIIPLLLVICAVIFVVTEKPFMRRKSGG